MAKFISIGNPNPYQVICQTPAWGATGIIEYRQRALDPFKVVKFEIDGYTDEQLEKIYTIFTALNYAPVNAWDAHSNADLVYKVGEHVDFQDSRLSKALEKRANFNDKKILDVQQQVQQEQETALSDINAELAKDKLGTVTIDVEDPDGNNANVKKGKK